MPMTQEDIRRHYEQSWKRTLDSAAAVSELAYSNPVEDAVLYPIYESLLRDLAIRIDGGRVLDVGSGSGRWARFLLGGFRPERFVGVDFASSSVELLRKWHPADGPGAPEFRVADITEAGLSLGGPFDLINVANVLFHIPEPDRFGRALTNLGAHLAPEGRIVTTEYLPRTSMRTEWMLVRSRYEFAAAAAAAGLRIVHIRASAFFANDPMGLDGPDSAVRGHFHAARARMQSVLSSGLNEQSRQFMLALFGDVERAALAFCAERVADIDLPSQKLVVLARAV